MPVFILLVIAATVIILFSNTLTLNRAFSSIINRDIKNLGLIAELSLFTAESRTEVYRFIEKYEPSTYRIKESFNKSLKILKSINSENMPEQIRILLFNMEKEIISIIYLTDQLNNAVRNRSSIKKAEFSSSLLTQSSMLVKLSEKLHNIVENHILIKQIDSKTSLIKNNIILSAIMTVFLMIIILFEVSQNKTLTEAVKSRTEELEKQVSVLKKTEHTLGLSEKRFADLYNNAPVSYFSLDDNGKITDVNNTLLKTMSCKKEDIINNPLENFIFNHDIELYKNILSELINRKVLVNKELRLVSRNNEIINIMISGNIDSGTGNYHCAFYDITDKKHLEEQLQHTEKMSAIGQLAGGIAHDFNNQLAGIMGYAELLRDIVHDPKAEKYADNILTISKRSSELVKQLLVFARKGQQIKTKINIHHLLKEAEVLIHRSIDKIIDLKLNLEAESSIISGDPGQIINIFLNMAINSRDAMPEGGEITISTESADITDNTLLNNIKIPAGKYIKITVKDTGEGIPDSLKDKIFEPFFTTKPTGKGTGMGLALVYSTVKNHDGFVDFYNRKEGGAVFSVYFPLVFTDVESSIERKSSEIEKIRGEYTILIADDEKMLREMTSESLSDMGYRTLEAEDGEQALNIYRKNPGAVDLVLLDLVMPKAGGYETFMQMKTINPEVKVIITTGYSFNENIPELITKGVKEVVMKPYSISDLLQLISEVISN